MIARILLIGAALVTLAAPASAAVARQAANFTWVNSAGKLESLSAFKGQPVIVVFAPSPRSWAFRSQVGQIQKMYERYAAAKAVFVAAFTQEQGLIRSNIPFVTAADGPRVSFDYDTGDKFAVAIIGRDGNLDYVTHKVIPAQRIYDILGASFVPQEAMRKP